LIEQFAQESYPPSTFWTFEIKEVIKGKRRPGGKVKIAAHHTLEKDIPHYLRSFSGKKMIMFLKFNAKTHRDVLGCLPWNEELEKSIKGMADVNNEDRVLGKIKTDLNKVKSLDLSGASYDIDDLVFLEEMTSLETLRLGGKNVKDHHLSYISGLKNLTTLDLSGTAISDEGLTYLAESKIKNLDLQRTKITSVGLSYIVNLKLTHLHLRDTAIDDEGLQNIQDMTTLVKLHFANTYATHDGLKYLYNLKNLKDLRFYGLKKKGQVKEKEGLATTGATSGGGEDNKHIKALKKALPNCPTIMY